MNHVMMRTSGVEMFDVPCRYSIIMSLVALLLLVVKYTLIHRL